MTVPFLAKIDFAYGGVLTAPSPPTTGQNFSISNADGFVLPDPATDGSFVLVYKRHAEDAATGQTAEKILVTAGIQTNATTYEVTACTRGYNGTTAQAIAVGGIIMLPPITDHLYQYEKLLLPTIRYVNDAEGGYARTPAGIRAAIAAGPGEVHVDRASFTGDGTEMEGADDVDVYWHNSTFNAPSSSSAATLFSPAGLVSSGVVLAANAPEGQHYIEVSAANIASIAMVEGSLLRIGATNFPGFFTCRCIVIDTGSTPNKVYIDRSMPLAALTANSATVYRLAPIKNFKMHDLTIDMVANTHASSIAMTRAYMDTPVLENVTFQNCAVGLYDYDAIIDPVYENVRITRCGSSDHDPDPWGAQDHSVNVSSMFITNSTGAKLDRVQAFYNDGGFALSIEASYHITGDQVSANGNQGRGFKTLDLMYATFTNARANANGATGITASGVMKKVVFIAPQANGCGGPGFGTPDNSPVTAPTDVKVIGGVFTGNNQVGGSYDIDLSAVSTRFKFIDCQFDTVRDLGTENSFVFTERSNQNELINGGFGIYQRQDPTTATSFADQAYGPDRWKVLTQTNTIKVNRTTGSAGASGYGSRYAAQLTQEQASAQRFGLQQIICNADAHKYRGRSMFFKIRAKISGTSPTNDCTLKVAIVEWTGTADSVPADPVATWTSTTYTVNNFFANTTYTIGAVGTLSLVAGADLTTVLIKASISGSANNIFVMVWTETTVAQNIVLTLETAHAGESSPLYSPLPFDEEVRRAQAYCQKSYNLDTAPGASNNTVGIISLYAPMTEASNNIGFGPRFSPRMRKTPTSLTLYDWVGTSGKVSEFSSNATVLTPVTPSTGAIHAGEDGFTVFHDPSGNIGGIQFHYIATAEL